MNAKQLHELLANHIKPDYGIYTVDFVSNKYLGLTFRKAHKNKSFFLPQNYFDATDAVGKLIAELDNWIDGNIKSKYNGTIYTIN